MYHVVVTYKLAIYICYCTVCCLNSTAGILVVVFSTLIIYYNIGLPNALKGFLFFIQVSEMS